MYVFLVCLLLATVPAVLSQFTNPKDGDILIVGDEITVSYTTSLTSYNIALWQQAPDEGSATLGPTVFNTTNGPETSFTWRVDSERLDLTYSKKFFFWLYPNGYRLNQSAPKSMTSGYFRISEKATDPSNSSLLSTSTATSTLTTSTSTFPTSTAPSAVPSTSATIDPGSSTSSSNSHSPTNESVGGLSASAKTGIGVAVGVGVGALIVIALVILFFRYRSKKDAQIQELRHEVQDKSFAKYPSPPYQSSQHHPGGIYQSAPAELGNRSGSPVELG